MNSSLRTLWLLVFFATLVWSGVHPKDSLTWLLEVLPALVGLVALVVTRHKFPLTRLAYVLILFHCVILMVVAIIPTPKCRSSTGFVTG